MHRLEVLIAQHFVGCHLVKQKTPSAPTPGNISHQRNMNSTPRPHAVTAELSQQLVVARDREVPLVSDARSAHNAQD